MFTTAIIPCLFLTYSVAAVVRLGLVTEIDSSFGQVDVFWINQDGQEVVVNENLEPFIPSWIDTFPGHRFVAKIHNTHDSEYAAEEQASNWIAEYTVHDVNVDQLFVIRNLHRSSFHCDMFSTDKEQYRACFTDREEWVTTSPRMQDNRRASSETRRDSNKEQPQHVPLFTPLGFEKRKVPDDLWRKITEFYNQNKASFSRERWPLDDTVVNFWSTPTYMIHMPETGSLKPAIFEGIRPLLEEWSGVSHLKATSCYGIRLYLNNSVLENHVDRLRTHAVSAIVNVDQDISEPWPLEIYDHDGNMHEILMEPGEMVFYESASCVHGRPKPFQGKYFANFFVHFAPLDTNLWWFTTDNIHSSLAARQHKSIL